MAKLIDVVIFKVVITAIAKIRNSFCYVHMTDFTQTEVVDTHIAEWNIISIIPNIANSAFVFSFVIVKLAMPHSVVVEQVHVLLQVVHGGLKFAEEVIAFVAVTQEVGLVEKGYTMTLWISFLTVVTLMAGRRRG